jgi:hypothetical protein
MNTYFVKIVVEALIFYLFFLSTNLFMGLYSFFFFFLSRIQDGALVALFNIFFFSHKLMLWASFYLGLGGRLIHPVEEQALLESQT